MKELMIFKSENFGEVRMIEVDGKPYAVASDVARALGYTNPQKAIRDHCKGVNEMDTPTNGGVQTVKIIPQGDIIRLVVKCRLDGAERFESWIFDEVIPSVLNNGGYIMNQDTLTSEQILANAVLLAQNVIAEKERLLLEARPKVDYYDRVLDTASEYTITQIAKECMMSGQALNLALSLSKIQYKQNGQWLLYAKYQNKGYTKTRTTLYNDSKGVENSKHTTVWTEKGREFILSVVDNL